MSFSLHLYLGPMHAGKTSQLIRNINEESLVIDYTESSYPHFGYITSHDKDKKQCIKLNCLCDLFILTDIEMIETFRTSKKILINEAQFFPDLTNFIKIIS